jgi:hypothetical protein
MKRIPIARIVLTIVFIAMLATPALMRRLSSQRGKPAAAQTDCAAALARYGFCFQEVSHQAGINFVHEAPILDSKLDGIMPEVASMGASVSIVDFDRDGWPDIYVTNSRIGSLNHLYRNNHDGTFTDVAKEMGIADVNQPGTGVSMGAVWGDYDNDGYEDLYLIKWGRPELFHNDGGKHFTRVTDAAGLQLRPLARLRRRRQARPLRRWLLSRKRRPLAPEKHAHDAREFRVREERRPQIPLPQSRQRPL